MPSGCLDLEYVSAVFLQQESLRAVLGVLLVIAHRVSLMEV